MNKRIYMISVDKTVVKLFYICMRVTDTRTFQNELLSYGLRQYVLIFTNILLEIVVLLFLSL